MLLARRPLIKHARPLTVLGATRLASYTRRSQPHPVVRREEDGRSTSYLWFNAVYPIKLGIWDIRYLFARVDEEALKARIEAALPTADPTLQIKVEQITPRTKDGGAFARFSWNRPTTEGENVEMEDEKMLLHVEQLARSPDTLKGVSPWSNWLQSKAFLVKGPPWMEDMNRFPNATLRVEFEGPEIPQEELYEIFRPYGKIHDIAPQPTSNKDLPRFANITYSSMRSATSARNCLNSALCPASLPVEAPQPPTVLRILYAERKQAHYVRDFVTGHPRIMLPLVVALLGTLSYAVFDPIREFFVKAHVEGTFDSDRWVLVSWLKRETLGRLGFSRFNPQAAQTGIEREREEAKEQLENWLRDVPDTFIVVTGPRGSGKTALVDEVLAEGKHVLTIDCQKLIKSARTDSKLVSELASAVGYFPQFALGSSLNNLIDLAAVGLIGQKAGFSASLDSQLKSILEVTGSALGSITAGVRAEQARKGKERVKEEEKERKEVGAIIQEEGVKDARVDDVAGIGAMSELGGGVEKGETLVVGPESSSFIKTVAKLGECPTEASSGSNVAALPVVVLKGFAAKGDAKETVLWDVLSEWAAVMTENQVAHVVFTSDSVQTTKLLAKALPNKPFNTIALTDASPESAIQYIETKLTEQSKVLPQSSYSSVAQLGGRQTDLELLVQKIGAGLEVDEAVEDIVSRNATEIRQTFFNGGGGGSEKDGEKKGWNREQAWKVMVGLTKEDELKYADILVNPPFKSDETALRALENAEMITITHRDGRPSAIRPGKPVYRSAFQLLLSDAVFSSLIQFETNKSALSTVSSELEAASRSLIELSKLFGSQNGKWVFGGGSTVPKEIEVRVKALLETMREKEDKLEQLENEKKRLLGVLKEVA